MTSTIARRIPLLLLVALLVGGCTADDRFKLAQPVATVSLEGGLKSVAAPGDSATCAPGTAVYWGVARNTGDIDVEDVRAVIDVFGADGALLGTFSDSVFNGTIDETGGSSQALTNLAAGQSGSAGQAGTFTVCTSVPFGLAARAEFHAIFVVVEPVSTP